MSRKKIDVRSVIALCAVAVVLAIGGVYYVQSGSDTEQASLVLSRPNVAIDAQTSPAEQASAGSDPTVSSTATQSPTATAKQRSTAKQTKKEATRTSTSTTSTTDSDGGGSSGGSAGTGGTDAVAAASAGGDRITFGTSYTGVATFYGATGAGNCSYDPTGDLMVAAMNEQDYEGSQACGAYLDVTGPQGNTIRVKIVDRCPECEAGQLDLSAQAFAELAEPSKGRIDISWKLVSPALSGPVSYVYKEGSTQWWCGIQVRNHRNPIRSVQLRGDNGWVTLDRQMYNYFLSESGEGCGGAVRITDVQGNQLTDTSIALTPLVEQDGARQLPAA